MHPVLKALSDYYKSLRKMQPETSYTDEPHSKLIEHLTHAIPGMHMYENAIDGTGLHFGMYNQEWYDEMDKHPKEYFPHDRRSKNAKKD